MSKRHTKAEETAGWWLRQLRAAHELWKKAEKRPHHYRKQLRDIIDLEVPQIVVADDENGADQIDILYLPRYLRWVRSQTFDEFPEVRYPKESRSDIMFGDLVCEVLNRVGAEADEMREWSGALADAGTDGVFAEWYGISVTDDVIDAEGLFDATLSTPEIIEAGVASGVAEAAPGQDHRAVADTAHAMASDPVTVLGPGGEQKQARLEGVAEAHEVAAEREAKKPHSMRHGRVQVWCQRRPVGFCTLWEADIDDQRDKRFVARKVVMDVDLMRSHPSFRSSVTNGIEPGVWRANFDDADFLSVDAVAQTGAESNKVAIWEIWDKKYQERHYVVEGCEEFLEKDARNPYVSKEDGRPIIKGFFPCVIRAPHLSNKLSPLTPFGIPTMAPGWPLQELAIKLASHNLDAVKKLTTRIIAMSEDVDDEVESKLTSGQTGTVVRTPAGQDVRSLVAPVNFGTVPGEVFQQFKQAEVQLASSLAWPLSQMIGAPVADTATAEQISVSAGYNQLGDFVREMEIAFAEAQEIKRALIREFYSDERIGELVGDDKVEAWNAWKSTSTAGDKLRARFNSRVMSEDPVVVKQAQDWLMLLSSFTDQSTGIPKYDFDQVVDMIGRMQGFGPALRHEPTEFEKKMAEMNAIAAAQSANPTGPGGGSSGKSPSGENPAKGQQLNAAAQKVGPSRSPGGRGMFP